MKTKLILLIDDDLSIQKLLKAALEKNGYTTMPCPSGEAALEKLEQSTFEAVILDVVLPNMDGWDVLKWIRNHPVQHQLPVIMLTCKDSEIETVLGLEMGADDYLSKPVRYHELMARLKKACKKNNAFKSTKLICIQGIEIDQESRTVNINKTLLPLSYREFELLTLLAKNPGKVFTRDHLLDLLWHDEQFLETRTVDVHIRRLRKKIEEHGGNPNIIETVRSIGYRLTNS